MDENKQNTETEINLIAMQIIVDAGDARLHISNALTAMENNQFDISEENISCAQEKLKSAHVAQTKIIQDEAQGILFPHSLLFTHAQDTLMTIKSDLFLTKHLLNVFKQINLRFQALEKND
jgi:PTS system cellobiose-specific IIA component